MAPKLQLLNVFRFHSNIYGSEIVALNFYREDLFYRTKNKYK